MAASNYLYLVKDRRDHEKVLAAYTKKEDMLWHMHKGLQSDGVYAGANPERFRITRWNIHQQRETDVEDWLEAIRGE